MKRSTKLILAFLSLVTLLRLSRVFLPDRDPTKPVPAPERLAVRHQLVEGRVSRVETDTARLFLEAGEQETAISVDAAGTRIHRGERTLGLADVRVGDRALVRWPKGQSHGAPIEIALAATSSAP